MARLNSEIIMPAYRKTRVEVNILLPIINAASAAVRVNPFFSGKS